MHVLLVYITAARCLRVLSESSGGKYWYYLELPFSGNFETEANPKSMKWPTYRNQTPNIQTYFYSAKNTNIQPNLSNQTTFCQSSSDQCTCSCANFRQWIRCFSIGFGIPFSMNGIIPRGGRVAGPSFGTVFLRDSFRVDLRRFFNPILMTLFAAV